MAVERGKSGFVENNAARVRNVGIIIALIGIVANPVLILPGAAVSVAGELGRANRQAARQGK